VSNTVTFSTLALQDIQDAVDYYHAEAGLDTARKFTEELRQLRDRLIAFPMLGSDRYSFELGLPGLRTIGLNRFPYIVFYNVSQHNGTDSAIRIGRVLHGKRDIPETLS
jgi:toxin ParE1/3/4